jgi:hypothetical protein
MYAVGEISPEHGCIGPACDVATSSVAYAANTITRASRGWTPNIPHSTLTDLSRIVRSDQAERIDSTAHEQSRSPGSLVSDRRF